MLKRLRQKLKPKKIRKPTSASLLDGYKKRKQRLREEEKKQRALEPGSLRLMTAIITFVAMSLGMLFVPLFPEPLPILVAFLIAFGAYEKPQFSIPVGGLVIGLGMMYHLAQNNFLSELGPPEFRVLFAAILLYLFVALPLRYHTCQDAIAINIGIMAATLLFFPQTYMFAIPLLLTTAVLFKQVQSVLALTYYALISVPLQITQFSEVIKNVYLTTRSDWWLDPRGVPPLYVPLNGIFEKMQTSMVQFRLFDASKMVNVVTSDLTGSPPASATWVGSALTQYRDSLPGIIMFMALLACLLFAMSTITPEFSKRNLAMRAELVLPAVAAAGITALFFLLAVAMQVPMAFRVELTTTQMAEGVFATLLFALPIAYVNYAPKRRAAVEERSVKVLTKAEELTAKLNAFGALLDKTKSNLPVDVASPEGKYFRIQERLKDIIAKTNAKVYDPSELEDVLAEMKGELGTKIDALTEELAELLREYQLHINYEYTSWLKKARELGFDVGEPVPMAYRKDMSIEERIDEIGTMIDAGRRVALAIAQTVEQTYYIIRELYDQSLPDQSRTLQFAKQQLAENKAPWFATDAMFTAINNWKRLYGKEVSKSVKYLLTSVDSLASLNAQTGKLQNALGQKYPEVMEYVERAEDLKAKISSKPPTVTDLPVLRDAFESTLNMSKDVLSILHGLMESKEAIIDNLLPVKEDFWERNISLREQTAMAIQRIEDAPEHELNKTMAQLPKALLYVNDCVETLAIYSDKEEMLLNYPVAKTAIEKLLKQQKSVTPKELPFDPRYAQEYLKLFYNSQTRRKFTFDPASLSLSKKP